MTGHPGAPYVFAVAIAALLIIVTIAAIVFIASLLDPPGAHARPPGPRHAARPAPLPLHHELTRFPGLLELEPVPPPADTGEIPVAVAELGMTSEAYVDDLFARHAQEVT